MMISPMMTPGLNKCTHAGMLHGHAVSQPPGHGAYRRVGNLRLAGFGDGPAAETAFALGHHGAHRIAGIAQRLRGRERVPERSTCLHGGRLGRRAARAFVQVGGAVGGAALVGIGQHPQNHVFRHAMGRQKAPGGNRAVAQVLGDALLDNEAHPGVVAGLVVHAASLFGLLAVRNGQHDNSSVLGDSGAGLGRIGRVRYY